MPLSQPVQLGDEVLEEPEAHLSVDLRRSFRFLLARRHTFLNLHTNLGAINWVGPHAPAEVAPQAPCWQGRACSQELPVQIQPARRRPSTVQTGRVWQKKMQKPRPTQLVLEASKRGASAEPAPPPLRPRPPPKSLKSAKATRGRPRRGGSAPARTLGSSRPETSSRQDTRGALVSTAPAEAAYCYATDLDFGSEPMPSVPGSFLPPGTAQTTDGVLDRPGLELPVDDRRVFSAPAGGRGGRGEQHHKRDCTTSRLPPLSDIAHGTSWRGLSRKLDPLADPCVLEVAEQVTSFVSPGALVVLCGECLNGRLGQRFADVLRALGSRVTLLLNARSLLPWAAAPCDPRSSEAKVLVLVVEWRAVAACLGVIRHAAQQQPFSAPVLDGVVLLCDHRDKVQAQELAASLDVPCPCRVMPSMAFQC